MQTKLKVTTVLFCGFVLLGGAGCGGSSGTARIIDLEDQLEAEREAREEAERQGPGSGAQAPRGGRGTQTGRGG